MRSSLEKVLRFAGAREEEAEAFYKDWAQRATDPAVRLLFGELGAAENGHWQLLAHITPSDLLAQPQQATDLAIAVELVEIKAHDGITLRQALVVAAKREEASAHLYEQLAGLSGESASLFRALASEEREHKRKVEAICDELISREN